MFTASLTRSKQTHCTEKRAFEKLQQVAFIVTTVLQISYDW